MQKFIIFILWPLYNSLSIYYRLQSTTLLSIENLNTSESLSIQGDYFYTPIPFEANYGDIISIKCNSKGQTVSFSGYMIVGNYIITTNEYDYWDENRGFDDFDIWNTEQKTDPYNGDSYWVIGYNGVNSYTFTILLPDQSEIVNFPLYEEKAICKNKTILITGDYDFSATNMQLIAPYYQYGIEYTQPTKGALVSVVKSITSSNPYSYFDFTYTVTSTDMNTFVDQVEYYFIDSSGLKTGQPGYLTFFYCNTTSLDCTSELDVGSCSGKYFIDNEETNCVKYGPTNYYQSSSNTLMRCHYKCEECSALGNDTNNNCDICISGLYNLNGNCIDSCPKYWYISGTQGVCIDNCVSAGFFYFSGGECVPQ